MREKLAYYAHDAWSRWMKYLFYRSITEKDGSYSIPKQLVDIWKRQSETEYSILEDQEKVPYQVEADRIIKILEEIYSE